MEFTATVITLGSFIAAYVNASFATGGVYFVIAACSSVMPLGLTVPLQPALVYSSLLGRIAYFRAHIKWPIVLAFTSGSVIGVFLGTQVFTRLSEFTLSLLVGGVLLLLVWLPRFRWRIPLKHPFFLIGCVHSFLSTLLAITPILQVAIFRTSLLKLQIISTLAACFFAQETLRIIGYAAHGFDYGRYLPLILLANAAGIAGTWTGKRTSHLISETTFRLVFRWLMTAIALRLLYRAWLLA